MATIDRAAPVILLLTQIKTVAFDPTDLMLITAGLVSMIQDSRTVTVKLLPFLPQTTIARLHLGLAPPLAALRVAVLQGPRRALPAGVV